MADRLTQLQDAVNVQAENLCNSIGFLQQCSRPTSFPDVAMFSRSPSQAYQQVLAQAGIPLDIEDLENFEREKEENRSSKADNKSNENGHLQKHNGNVINGDGTNQIPLTPDPGDNSKFFAKLITKTAKDIDLIIDSLPSREMEPDLQEAHIKILETENREEAKKLQDVINQAEKLLNFIKEALEDIAQNQMRMKQLEAQMLTLSSASSSSTIIQGGNNNEYNVDDDDNYDERPLT